MTNQNEQTSEASSRPRPRRRAAEQPRADASSRNHVRDAGDNSRDSRSRTHSADNYMRDTDNHAHDTSTRPRNAANHMCDADNRHARSTGPRAHTRDVDSPRSDARARTHSDSRGNSSNDARARIARGVAPARSLSVRACAALLVVGCLVGLLFFARPSVSALEKRALTPFPAFTVQSFLDGSFFSDLSLWYADTYPLREPMVTADHALEGLYGMQVRTGLIGGNVAADAIPVAGSSSAAASAAASASSLSVSDVSASTTAQPAVPAAQKPEGEVDAPYERSIAEAVQDSIMNGLYIKDGAAYAIFYFYQPGADLYIDAVNSATEQLAGTSHVYSIIVPSSAIALPDDEYNDVGGSDQRQVLDYLWSRLDDRATHVDLIETMKAHRGEYTYFRTDHHWTMLGGYYGYVEFCRAKGIEPEPLESFERAEGGSFGGTYYDSIASLTTPDVDDFFSYTPHGTNEMTTWGIWDSDEEQEAVVDNADDYETDSKYDSLLGADDARQFIDNPNINDGSSCLIVKDSYACAFGPFLVGHYDKVHVIDPRYYGGNVCDFARENNVDDVIFLFGIKVGLNEQYAGYLYDSIVE